MTGRTAVRDKLAELSPRCAGSACSVCRSEDVSLSWPFDVGPGSYRTKTAREISADDRSRDLRAAYPRRNSHEQFDRLDKEANKSLRREVRRESPGPPSKLRLHLFAAGGAMAMREITYRQALNEALAEELERDPNVFLMGEEVAEYNGAYKVSQGLLERFGPKRIIDTPISENGFAGVGVGAAMVGLRPIIEFMTFSFSFVAFDQVVNNAPNMLTMSGGQVNIPITFRGPNGPAHQLGATHSHATECLYANFPGLKICTPATPRDAKGLLKTAIRDNDPVLVLEVEMLYSSKVMVEDENVELLIPLGEAEVKREGSDVTIICYAQTVPLALAAAETLERGRD